MKKLLEQMALLKMNVFHWHLTDVRNKNYERYLRRLKSMLKRYDIRGINYYDPFNPEKTPEPQQ